MLKVSSITKSIFPRFELPQKKWGEFVTSLEKLHRTSNPLLTPPETRHASREYAFTIAARKSGNGNTGESFTVYDTTAQVNYTPSVPLTFELIEGELEGLQFTTGLNFRGNNDVRFTTGIFPELRGRWGAYIREAVGIDETFPQGDHILKIRIDGTTHAEGEKRWQDLAGEYNGKGKVYSGEFPTLSLQIQRAGPFTKESEQLVRTVYNEVLRFGLNYTPRSITQTRETESRLRALVEAGRGLQGHEDITLDCIPPALTLEARYPTGEPFPRMVDFAGLRAGRRYQAVPSTKMMFVNYESKVTDVQRWAKIISLATKQ